jgi:hypothetical protein
MQMQYKEAIDDFQRYLLEGTDEFWLEATRRQLDELADLPAASPKP